MKATETIKKFFDAQLPQLPAEAGQARLLKWVNFIRDSANVIVVRVGDELGAYRIFETLNDRGLRAEQADLLKNFFFSKASQMRVTEAQNLWNNIGAVLETLGDDESDLLVTYIKHLWITENGATKERVLAERVKQKIGGSEAAFDFLATASNSCEDYVALWSESHSKWDNYLPETRKYIETIHRHLQVEQIRPLLFAVARHFDVEEANKAFRLFVSWSVRFLIYGGRGGMLDLQYSRCAHSVGTGAITKASELRSAMQKYVPSDSEFRQAFESARVSRPRLARYYLRSLEKTKAADPNPEYVANPEITDVNLEHVLPLTITNDWNVDQETAKALQKRLGNMVLLRSPDNTTAGNRSFEVKKQIYSNSSYKLTKAVSQYQQWTSHEVENRQAQLAKLAVQTWPLTFD